MKKLFGLLALGWAVTLAAEAPAVIHFYAEGKLEPVKNEKTSCRVQEKGPIALEIQSKEKLSPDRWTAVSCSFVPQFTGNVTIYPVGIWKASRDKKGNDQVWIYYDNFKLQGAVLQNGSFENGAEGWELCGKDPKAVIVEDSALAADGRHCLAAWLGSTYRQTFAVKKGVPVKLEFQARYNETVPAGE